MGEAYILDTSTIIKYINGTLPAPGNKFLDIITNEESVMSVISKIEVLAWNPKFDSELIAYKEFIDSSDIIPLDDSIIDKTIEIRKNFKLKLLDAIIAATAMASNRTLVADNDNDFLKIPNLKYINPRKLS